MPETADAASAAHLDSHLPGIDILEHLTDAFRARTSRAGSDEFGPSDYGDDESGFGAYDEPMSEDDLSGFVPTAEQQQLATMLAQELERIRNSDPDVDGLVSDDDDFERPPSVASADPENQEVRTHPIAYATLILASHRLFRARPLHPEPMSGFHGRTNMCVQSQCAELHSRPHTPGVLPRYSYASAALDSFSTAAGAPTMACRVQWSAQSPNRASDEVHR